jgi:16S rRNA processing protein RimM
LDKKLGKIGVVNKIDFNRPQTILFVKSEEKTILIPYVKELITNINHSKKEIELDLPEGIIDICSE